MVLYSWAFDKNAMGAETKVGDKAIVSSTNTRPIQLCLLPAIYAHNLPRQGVVDHVLEVKPECGKDPDLCLITKAVVGSEC